MKFAIPEISWHNRDPVLSVDIQPKTNASEPLRLATGGTDSHVVIWYLSKTITGSVKLEVATDLTRHQKAVNVVRWSPNGVYLASGDDESIIFIWKQKTEEPIAPPLEGEEQYKETWVIHKTLRGHMEDVLDISWSSSSLHLASGSVDNKLIVWDVARARSSGIVSDHKGFVQGVAWDPQGQLIATASSDRVFRTFDVGTKKVLSRSSKAILPFPKEHTLHEVKVRLYHDDTLQTYYRRLHFSPDGMFIAAPAGRIEPEQGKLDIKPMNAVYIYTRHSLKTPACVVPCGEPALVCRWSPVRRAARTSPPAPSALQHAPRLLLAVATRRSLLLYDTHQKAPVALISNIHYTRITDLSWSSDGLTLVASSTDGFCSVVSFTEEELGEALTTADAVSAEPMETEEQKHNQETPKQRHAEAKPIEVKRRPSSNNTKIDAYIKFKTPEDKSPKKKKIENIQQKTPVKMDVLMETALPSWSDNSSNDLIRPKDTETATLGDENDVTVIEDSEDIQLVYEETKDGQSPKTEPSEEKPAPKTMSPKQCGTADSNFLMKAKITDIREPAPLTAVPSPKAPRRVSFVTLSSPKSTKKK
ncbi:chromatin assembly factor 1 subunit B-like [Danaus plexippus]|uniref:chromatin assembly factor 1 subunit B-like n=1 Tax=Danaus plexippus TaxID=13037 RepID=UPI002AB11BD8|nr:chromatin assembly factor 1 subunit B-like [Danaus plexippus]